MPDLLRFVVFTPDLLELVRDFEYGDKPHQKDLADWMSNDVLAALERGTKVWLYVNEAGDIVGYGSLGVTRWRYPETTSTRVDLLIVPAVALRRVYWGKPDGADRDDRYSSQIMRHLLAEAAAWPGSFPAIGLFVHPDNHAAIKLYERFGFQPFFHSYTDPGSGVLYRSFVRQLQPPSSNPTSPGTSSPSGVKE